jgi:hypothetical protein
LKNYAALLTVFTLSFFSPVLRADQITVLGTAYDFAVLGAAGVTNSGSTVVYGNVGSAPISSISGFSSATVTGGTFHANDGVAIGAQADALNAYNYLAGLSSTEDLSGQDLGGLTLTPGVYTFSKEAQLTGVLTLDFKGLSNVDIVIQTGTTLITATNSAIHVINQGTNDNVYYEVGSSATLGTDSTFAGDILAGASVTFDTGAGSSCGSAIALSGAVTLLSNNVHNCSTTGSDVTQFVPVSLPDPSTVPEPGAFTLLATGLLGGAAALRRKLLP